MLSDKTIKTVDSSTKTLKVKHFNQTSASQVSGGTINDDVVIKPPPLILDQD